MLQVTPANTIGLVLSFLIIFKNSAYASNRDQFYEQIEGEYKKFVITAYSGVNVIYKNAEQVSPSRVEVWSNDGTREFPILVVVQQIKHVTSWQIPLLVESSQGLVEYNETARTLCQENGNETYVDPNNFTITLTTFSVKSISVFLKVSTVDDYSVDSNETRNITFSPSQPTFYTFVFPEKNVTEIEIINTVQIRIFSNDDVCFIVSVQAKKCPIYDLNDDIAYQGRYQSVNSKAALTVTRDQFPNGFVVVFVATADNYLCNSEEGRIHDDIDDVIVINNRTSILEFQIVESKSALNYVSAMLALFLMNLALCVVSAVVTCIFYKYGDYYQNDKISAQVNELYVQTDQLTLDQMSSKGDEWNSKKATNYCWHVGNIAIFYGLPVMQLMYAYQRAINYSGDLDICYHNTFCSHPYYFTDFNHIYSNIGYVMFGVLFLGITAWKVRHLKRPNECGIARHSGVYYAMGGALVLEGLCSGLYHICPNQANFQFDTTFMYVICVLVMIKLYQNRHPDITATAYASFTFLGYFIFVAFIGILHNYQIVRLIALIFHMLFCLYVSLKLYYDSGENLFLKAIEGYRKGDITLRRAMAPNESGKFTMLIFANLMNLGLGIWGIVVYKKFDFGSILLFIAIANSLLYVFYYSSKKLKSGETLCYQSVIYALTAIVLWFPALIYFYDALTKWMDPPALSRQLNRDCHVMNFYDYHDIWHILSAPALFFTFMFVSAVDDDQYAVSRKYIPVF